MQYTAIFTAVKMTISVEKKNDSFSQVLIFVQNIDRGEAVLTSAYIKVGYKGVNIT